MTKDRELIHRLLDGDLSEADEKLLRKQAETDPGLRRELEGLSGAVRMVKGPRLEPPADFTRLVMQRLPAREPSLLERLQGFLLRGRTLRWNMATALATAMVLAVTATIFIREQGPAVAPPAQVAERQTVTVRLAFFAPQARGVSVAGDFNRWQAGAHAMSKQDGGVWTIDLSLEPGVYSYMFVLDGKAWITDPGAGAYEDDGFGNKNAVMRIGL